MSPLHTAPKLTLYHYWRSSTSWRVRWVFALKGIRCDFVSVNLLSDEPESEAHRQRNPLGYVPVLAIKTDPSAQPFYISESMALMEWAEETHPEPSILPGSAYNRAQIRQLAEVINSDTAPLQNLTPQHFHSDHPDQRKRWAQHWIQNGLAAYEALVKKSAGKFSVGDQLTMADICLIPQCYNATRYEVSIRDFPTIARIYAEAITTNSYLASEPERFKPA